MVDALAVDLAGAQLVLKQLERRFFGIAPRCDVRAGGRLGEHALLFGLRIFDRLRLRAFPFADAVADFIAAHEHVFVVEQNRDAQLRMLIVNECEVDPGKLIPVLHYDGTPITERFITREIAEKARLFNVVPLRQTGAA